MSRRIEVNATDLTADPGADEVGLNADDLIDWLLETATDNGRARLVALSPTRFTVLEPGPQHCCDALQLSTACAPMDAVGPPPVKMRCNICGAGWLRVHPWQWVKQKAACAP